MLPRPRRPATGGGRAARQEEAGRFACFATVSYRLATDQQVPSRLREMNAVQAICCHLAALTVACIYYSWRAYANALRERQRTLRERVTYMLWVAASQVR